MQGVELDLKEPKLWNFQDNRRKINILGIVTGTRTVSSKHDLTVLCLCFYTSFMTTATSINIQALTKQHLKTKPSLINFNHSDSYILFLLGIKLYELVVLKKEQIRVRNCDQLVANASEN